MNSQKSSIDNLLLLVIHIELVNLFLRTIVIPYAPLAKKKKRYKYNQKLGFKTENILWFFVIG